MEPIGTFRIGEDASVALDVVTGDASLVTGAVASMRRVATSGIVLSGDPIAVSIAPRAASGSFPAGWNVTVPASISVNLQPGMYAIDVTLTGVGFTEITDTSAFIAFRRGVN